MEMLNNRNRTVPLLNTYVLTETVLVVSTGLRYIRIKLTDCGLLDKETSWLAVGHPCRTR
jgi:hypothetical protein